MAWWDSHVLTSTQIIAIDGGITKVKMDDGGSVRNVPSVKVKASGCPDIDGALLRPPASLCSFLLVYNR